MTKQSSISVPRCHGMSRGKDIFSVVCLMREYVRTFRLLHSKY